MGTKLTDLTARTATAESDLIHVNSGDVDYKETKANFLGKIPRNIEFNNTSALTTQVDALDWGPYTGYILATTSTSLSATGMPVQATYALSIYKYSAQNIVIHADALQGERRFTRRKSSGTWGAWSEDPSRSEMDNVLLKFPSNIASFSEFDSLASSGGFYTFRTSASFTCGNGTMPNYGRGIIMNYSSSDSSFILVCPTGFVYGFKNSGNWLLKQISF